MLIDKLIDLSRNYYYFSLLKSKGAVFNPKAINLQGKIIFDIYPGSVVNLGDVFCCVGSGSVSNYRCSKIAVQKGAKFNAGVNCSIKNSVIWCSEEIEIGDNVVISPDCMIMDTDFHSLDWRIRMTKEDCKYRKKKKVRIGSNVLIEEGCIIGKGVQIGENVIVKSDSVVTRNIPSNEVWGGNPAIFICKN